MLWEYGGRDLDLVLGNRKGFLWGSNCKMRGSICVGQELDWRYSSWEVKFVSKGMGVRERRTNIQGTKRCSVWLEQSLGKSVNFLGESQEGTRFLQEAYSLIKECEYMLTAREITKGFKVHGLFEQAELDWNSQKTITSFLPLPFIIQLCELFLSLFLEEICFFSFLFFKCI